MPGIDQFRSVSHDTAKTETQKLRCKHQRCRLQLSRPGPSPSAWWVMMHKIQFNGWRMTISRIHELCRLSFHRTWKRSRSRYIVAPGKPMTGVEKKTSLRKNSGLAWRAIGISLQHSKPQIGDISENNPVKISLLIRGLFVLSLVRFVKRNVEVYVYSRVTDIKIYQKNQQHHYHNHHCKKPHYHNHHYTNHHYQNHHYQNHHYHSHHYVQPLSQPPLSQPPRSQPPLSQPPMPSPAQPPLSQTPLSQQRLSQPPLLTTAAITTTTITAATMFNHHYHNHHCHNHHYSLSIV